MPVRSRRCCVGSAAASACVWLLALRVLRDVFCVQDFAPDGCRTTVGERKLLRMSHSFLWFSGLAALLTSSIAQADIYRWTDKNGDVVFSNVAPSDGQTAWNVTLVTKSSTIPVQAPPPGPTNQELAARIQSLEHQLQIAAQAAAAAPVYQSPPVVYVQPAPTPVVTYHDSGLAGAYESSLYPFVPSMLPVTVVTVTPFRGRSSHFDRRGMRHSSFHGGGGRGGNHGSPGGNRGGGDRRR